MFAIIFCYHLMNLPFRHQSMNYFNQSIRICLITFFIWMFFWANWNWMFTLLVLWFSPALKLFNYGIVITKTIMTLIRGLIFAISLFCYARRHSSVWFSNLFLNKVFWIIVDIFPHRRNLSKFDSIFPIFLLNSRKLIYTNKIFLSGLRK